MSHQAGLTLMEVLISLIIFNVVMLGLFQESSLRQKQVRQDLEILSRLEQLENIHESS